MAKSLAVFRHSPLEVVVEGLTVPLFRTCFVRGPFNIMAFHLASTPEGGKVFLGRAASLQRRGDKCCRCKVVSLVFVNMDL